MSEPFDEDAVSVQVLEQIDRLCLDFESAFRAGHAPALESYLKRLPPDCYRAALYYLIQLERDLLCDEGKKPSLQQYRDRFPEQRLLVELAWGEPALFEVLLEAIVGPHRGRRFVFRQHDSFIVGRAECAHFQFPLKDSHFSRVHFLVEVNPPYCRLVDLCSLNGTKVNGQRVDWIDLRDGDLIECGVTVIRVSIHTPEYDLPLTVDLARQDEPHAVRKSQGTDGRLFETEARDLPPHIPGYELMAQMGRGGMGVVHRAQRLADGVQVAIKVIRSACMPSDYEVRRFLREAQILCALRHPNIVAFHQFGRSNDLFYIVMDFVPGCDAARLVKRCGPMAIGRAVRIICQALEALQYAHEEGFVHRDVKPNNLLISGDESAEVCQLADFGLGRVYHTTRMSGLTLMGDIGGTLPFMAPEQITNFHDAKPAADQYGAAATLYYLCTQQCMFADDPSSDGRHIARNILLGDPVPIEQRRADIPSALGRMIHKALAKKPEDRFANGAEFRAALSAYEHS